MSTALDTLLTLVLVLAWTMLVRKFPDILSKGIVKQIEHGYDKKLEELKGGIQAHNTAIKSSVEFLAASQSELRSKVISSVESLWLSIDSIHEVYSGAVTITLLFLPDEIEESLKGKRPGILQMVKDYEDITFIKEKFREIQRKTSGTEVLFVSSRLWLLYNSILRVHARLGILLNQSMKDRKYQDWRNDKFMESILGEVLTADKIKEAKQNRLGGINNIINWLKAEFVQEASNLVRGSREVAHSVPEIYETLRRQSQIEDRYSKSP